MNYAKYFFALISLLIVVGLVFIYSASGICGLEQHDSSYYFLKRQVIGLLIGLLSAAIIVFIPLKTLRTASPILLIVSISLVLLSFTKTFGCTIHGASRWIRLGSLSLQPAEFLKISWLLFTAHCIDRYERNFIANRWMYYMLLSLTALCSLLLLKQPDFGNAVLIMSVGMILFFIARLPLRRILFLIMSILPIIALLIAFKPYRLKRVITFLNPWHDPQGAGFQIIQSLIAIGAGGWTGLGIGHSKQKFFYLPMHYTDFIFSIIVEEIGFLGGLVIILMYGVLLVCGVGYAISLRSTFARILCIGVSLLISLQALFHIGVAMGLLPTKGIGLPFISYGSSSLVGLLCSVGLILNTYKSYKKH